tara:strand:- start:81 stop:470 length:390 start_codon:yes stop_codon:yes gene_type:complete
MLEITIKDEIPREIIRKNHKYHPEFLDSFFELKYIGVNVALLKISNIFRSKGKILINSITKKIINADGRSKNVNWLNESFSPIELITLILNSKKIKIAPIPKNISKKYFVNTFALIFETTIDNLFEFIS